MKPIPKKKERGGSAPSRASVNNHLVAKDVTVHFHKEGLIFNGNDDAMSRLMLQMMGAFSEFERALINERQREGIAARKAGKQFGRKKALSVDQITDIRERVSQGQQKSLLAVEYCISRTTLYSALAN